MQLFRVDTSTQIFRPDRSDWLWGPPPELRIQWVQGISGRRLKLANHIHLALRWQKRTALLLPPYDMMAYRRTTFKHGTYTSITVLRFTPHKIGQELRIKTFSTFSSGLQFWIGTILMSRYTFKSYNAKSFWYKLQNLLNPQKIKGPTLGTNTKNLIFAVKFLLHAFWTCNRQWTLIPSSEILPDSSRNVLKSVSILTDVWWNAFLF